MNSVIDVLVKCRFVPLTKKIYMTKNQIFYKNKFQLNSSTTYVQVFENQLELNSLVVS